jgi:hypothetical protein
MVRHVDVARPRSWMALLAIVIAGGGLFWHILACMESPMAFSPDGKTLAFVTMDPLGDLDKQPLPGEHAFRLMVLGQDRKIRALEQSVDDMLTGPGFSPDGKRLCYVRVPLRTAEQTAAVEERVHRCEQALQQAERAAATAPSSQPSGEPPTEAPGATAESGSESAASQPSLAEDLSLPSVEKLAAFLEKTRMLEPMICTLVERDLASGRVASTTPVPAIVSPNMARLIYSLARPQYAPDGQVIYVTLGEGSYRVEPANGKTALVAANTAASVLSPDGKTVAVLCEDAVELWSTDARKAIYFRCQGASLNGLAWIDAQTLGVLTGKPQSQEGPTSQSRPSSTQEAPQLLIQRMRVDGSTLEPIRIQVPPGSYDNAEGMGDLAISPDGRHIAIAYGRDVFFGTPSGRILKHIHSEQDTLLEQPAFAPDGRRAAFKLIEKEAGNVNRVTAIVFFTPDGQEQYRVPVPAIPPGTTRPATQPARQANSGS